MSRIQPKFDEAAVMIISHFRQYAIHMISYFSLNWTDFLKLVPNIFSFQQKKFNHKNIFSSC